MTGDRRYTDAKPDGVLVLIILKLAGELDWSWWALAGWGLVFILATAVTDLTVGLLKDWIRDRRGE